MRGETYRETSLTPSAVDPDGVHAAVDEVAGAAVVLVPGLVAHFRW